MHFQIDVELFREFLADHIAKFSQEISNGKELGFGAAAILSPSSSTIFTRVKRILATKGSSPRVSRRRSWPRRFALALKDAAVLVGFHPSLGRQNCPRALDVVDDEINRQPDALPQAELCRIPARHPTVDGKLNPQGCHCPLNCWAITR